MNEHKNLPDPGKENNCKKKHNGKLFTIIVIIAILTLVISLLSVWGILKLKDRVKRAQQTGYEIVVVAKQQHNLLIDTYI